MRLCALSSDALAGFRFLFARRLLRTSRAAVPLRLVSQTAGPASASPDRLMSGCYGYTKNVTCIMPLIEKTDSFRRGYTGFSVAGGRAFLKSIDGPVNRTSQPTRTL